MRLEFVRFVMQSIPSVGLDAVLADVADLDARAPILWISVVQNKSTTFAGASMAVLAERCRYGIAPMCVSFRECTQAQRMRTLGVAL